MPKFWPRSHNISLSKGLGSAALGSRPNVWPQPWIQHRNLEAEFEANVLPRGRGQKVEASA